MFAKSLGIFTLIIIALGPSAALDKPYVHEEPSFRILAVLHTWHTPNQIIGMRLVQELVAKRHNVTVISPFKAKSLTNYRHIHIDGMKVHKPRHDYVPYFHQLRKMNVWQANDRIAFSINYMAKYTLFHNGFQELLQSDEEHFDLIILDVLGGDVFLPLASHFSAPILGISSEGTTKHATAWVGSPSPPSYVPNELTSYSERMTFFERFINLGLTGFSAIMKHWSDYNINSIVNGVYPGNYNKDIFTLRSNVSVVLSNNHYTVSYPRPHSQNLIDIGGMHIYPDEKRIAGPPLPLRVQEQIDESPDGIIYFSVGSRVSVSEMLAGKKIDALMNVFSKMKQTVFMQWDGELIPAGMPKNVYAQKWFSQDAIFSRGCVKVFITHGGLLSSMESIYHRVPIIGIPLFGDQYIHVDNAVRTGRGIRLDFENITEVSMLWALNEVLHNSKYENNACEMSAQYRERMSEPLAVAYYWCKYAIRHKGERHLHSAEMELSLIEYFYLDLISIFVLTLIAAIQIWKLFLLISRFCLPYLYNHVFFSSWNWRFN